MILDNLTLLYLAAVLLKQLVKKHWQEGEESFEPPVVSADEKVPYSFISIFFLLLFKTRYLQGITGNYYRSFC
jgi:hypothetical protein